MPHHDVIVVGGGIAGASLATVLSRAGLDVLVLERERRFADRGRDEWLVPWGVREALDLDLGRVLEKVPFANVVRRHVTYDADTTPEAADAEALDLGNLLPDVDGCVALGHPETAAALLAAATSAGAAVLRGAERVEVTPGDLPTVSFSLYGVRHQRSARLVVGADGRSSSVRAQAGMRLSPTRPGVDLAGLLVEDAHDWPRATSASGIDDDTWFFVFPQAGGRVRLYIAFDRADIARFAGPDHEERFLDSFRLQCLPAGGAALAEARPAGPLATYPCGDAWAEQLTVPGVVLIGDAAGWSDPVLGQGLAVALRDVAVLAEVVRGSDDWSPQGLRPYVEERTSRMARLRALSRISYLLHPFGTAADELRRRRRRLAHAHPTTLTAARATALVGPWRVGAGDFLADLALELDAA